MGRGAGVLSFHFPIDSHLVPSSISLSHCFVSSLFSSNNFLILRSALPKHARSILSFVNDAIFTVATIVFFAAAILYLRACERLK